MCKPPRDTDTSASRVRPPCSGRLVAETYPDGADHFRGIAENLGVSIAQADVLDAAVNIPAAHSGRPARQRDGEETADAEEPERLVAQHSFVVVTQAEPRPEWHAHRPRPDRQSRRCANLQ